MDLLRSPSLQRLTPPAVTLLVLFLAFTSQWLFARIEPGPLRAGDAYLFDTLVACLLISYWRTCFTHAGVIPKDWRSIAVPSSSSSQEPSPAVAAQNQRWCRKCEAFKPQRAHHCKTCKRCVLKMDHHCVWTANCVSHITIPHFIRFLFYAVISMIYLESFLYTRAAILWQKRRLPSYLGPSSLQLAHLFVLCAVNSFVLFALILLLGRTVWSLAVNTWTIESWEIERHHALLRRARTLGGFLEGPDGVRVLIEHQEFPWDIGIWANICQGMGSRFPLSWFWPFAGSPSVQSGLSYEHNEIEDPSKPWPPPDPDRLFRVPRKDFTGDGFTRSLEVTEFKKRQAADMDRYKDASGEYVVRRRPFHERLQQATQRDDPSFYESDSTLLTDDEDGDDDKAGRERNARDGGRHGDGEEAWRNSEGERLADYGVDESADFYDFCDEDDLPLAELLRRRKGPENGS